MTTTQSTYDYYAALCRTCTDRGTKYNLYSALARRSIQETADWYRVYNNKAKEYAALIIEGSY